MKEVYELIEIYKMLEEFIEYIEKEKNETIKLQQEK